MKHFMEVSTSHKLVELNSHAKIYVLVPASVSKTLVCL